MKVQIKYFRNLISLIVLGTFIVSFIILFKNNSTLANKDTNLVFLANVEGDIKAGTYQYLKRVMKEAEREKADYLIIQLDTPGGLVKPTRDIVDLILTSSVKTLIFVHKEGGWAYSAGTFILLAADVAVVHPEASIGAAQPRGMSSNGNKEVDQKIIEGMASWIKSLALANQKNSEIAEKFVRENLTLTGKEAKEKGVIDETATNLNELFLKLNISNPKVKKIDFNLVEIIFDFISHPYLVSFLLTLGGLAIFMAIRSGEFEFTGILGIIFLLLGLWGIGIITFSFLGIALILLGISLLMVEIFEPGFGIFGISGLISILLGIFTFENEPFFKTRFFDLATILVVLTFIVFCVIFIIVGKRVMVVMKSKPATGPESLIGFEAEVIKELNPVGKVNLRGEIWQAESASGERISEKSKVKIIKVEGNTLFVEKLEQN